MTLIAHTGAAVFDGARLWGCGVLLTHEGRFVGVGDAVPAGAVVREWSGGTVLPGFVDLQVNGGGGVLFNDAPTIATLRVMAQAHRALGTRAFLPTLITDSFDQTKAAIDAVALARAQGMPGIAGLHLEGPHLALARKGAHDGALIRPMDGRDLALLCDAVPRVGNLMVTVAPESVSAAQISALHRAGVIVSLGHSDCSYDDAIAAMAAGATCVTHLFNAMSGLASRAPGLVGAALEQPVAAGLIADGVHVHPTVMRAALRAKPVGVFLVSDAMATAGSDIGGFTLNGRQVLRRHGRLTLADGTLAGADLTMGQAVGVMVSQVGVPLTRALAMATSVPAALLRGFDGVGRFSPGLPVNAIHIAHDGTVTAV